MNKYYLFLALFLVSLASPVQAKSVPYKAGKLYCQLTSPASSIKTFLQTQYKGTGQGVKQACEEQHIIPQKQAIIQTKGTSPEWVNVQNVAWWPTWEHTRTDRWKSTSVTLEGTQYKAGHWVTKRPSIWFRNKQDQVDELTSAYMMGSYGLKWTLFLHNYGGKKKYVYQENKQDSGRIITCSFNSEVCDPVSSRLVATKFNGVSNALYGYSWFINIPQKVVNGLAYTINKRQFTYFIDWFFSLFVLAIEAFIAILMTVIGVVLGTILHPINTIMAIPAGIELAIDTSITAFTQLIAGIWRLVTGIF